MFKIYYSKLLPKIHTFGIDPVLLPDSTPTARLRAGAGRAAVFYLKLLGIEKNQDPYGAIQQIFAQYHPQYMDFCAQLAPYLDIPDVTVDKVDASPYWNNLFFTAGDARISLCHHSSVPTADHTGNRKRQ